MARTCVGDVADQEGTLDTQAAMNPNILNIEALPAETQRMLDGVCTRFEQIWKRGGRPSIEDFWHDVHEAESAILLKELLRVELDYRRLRGESPGVLDYSARFRNHLGLVADVCRAHQDISALAQSPSTALPIATVGATPRIVEATLPTVAGYDVLGQIGRGGMSVVYKARDRKLGRLVALKLVSAAEPSDELVSRFRVEAQAVAQLQHPHIVQIYEIGEHQQRPYLALEYVNGGNLAEWAAGNPQPPNEAAKIVEMLARAVSVAHRQGIVHRDLKPANVLIQLRQPLGSVTPLVDAQFKIADFGLAKFLNRDIVHTQSGHVVGTASYMAPEQAAGNANVVGLAADIYALGAILYELITGRPPFKAATVVESVILLQTVEPVPLRQLQPNTPRDLETVCLKCLQKDPNRRYVSSLELADDLQRFLRGAPVRARPIGPLQRAYRWSRRNQLVASLVATVAMLLISGTMISCYFAVQSQRRASNNLQLAESNRQLAEQEREAKAVAVAEREQSQTVLEYLVEVFRSPDPERDGRMITVAEMLDRATQQLDTKQFAEPLIKAELLNALGRSYYGLGLASQAVELLELAADLMQTQLGSNDERTLLTLDNLVLAYGRAGRHEDAIHLAERNLDRFRRLYGEDHPDALAAASHLGMAYFEAGHFHEASKLLEATLATARNKFGATDRRTLITLTNLALIYTETGQLDKAIELQEQAVAGIRATTRMDNQDSIGALNNLAMAYVLAGRAESAAEVLEEVLQWAREKLGDDHPMTLRALGNLARAYRDAGDFQRALPLAQGVLQQKRDRLGENHPDTLNAMAGLAVAYHGVGQLDQALPIYKDVLEKRRTTLGEDHPLTLLSMTGLGKALWETGQLDQAAMILRKCLQLRENNLPDNVLLIDTQLMLGGVLLESNHLKEAESTLFAAYQRLHVEKPQIPVSCRARISTLLQRIVELYEMGEHPGEAEEWRRRQSQLSVNASNAGLYE